MKRQFGIVCAVSALFISCASSRQSLPRSVYLTNKAAFELLPPSDIEAPLDGVQQIEGSFGGKKYLMDAYVLANDGKITMILYNAMGAELASALYDGRAVTFNSAFFPKNIKAEYLVADFQLVFYKKAALEKRLRACGLRFESTDTTRIIYADGKPVITITKSARIIHYVNHLRGYSYMIRGNFSHENT
jgi:hypothetical protein